MEIIFCDAAGTVLFTRLDMESGHWVQHEMSINAVFPFDNAKQIKFGQRIAFRDAENNFQVFEIRNVVNIEPDHYQQITAEHIAISELSDEHIDKQEITDKTAQQALSSVLSGTGWAVGNNTASGTQSADISRGNVWNAVNVIQKNWNVYIIPRITRNSAGAINHKYLDIIPAQGTNNGLFLSVHKNLFDPSVTYDDTNVYTALYGYGGSVDVQHTGEDDTREELTFSDVVWSQTSSHPAKPAGQKYLEWPEMTAIYGRNGRPRFGYYQNSDITDANILLQKTWETLQKTCQPQINISGTCADLYRLGYNDVPLRLHDTAIIEIAETGEHIEKEIITLDVDLIDPTATQVEIGDYIPNIIYINRETEEQASGGGGGGGGGHGQSQSQYDESETWTQFVHTNELIGMVVGTRQGTNYIKAGEITLAINKSGQTGSYESTATINADHVNISGTSTVYTLAGDLVHDPTTGRQYIKSAGGMYVQRTESGTTASFGVWDRGNLTGGVMVQQINGQTAVKISGNVIQIDGTSLVIHAANIDIAGVVSALDAYDISCGNLTAANIHGTSVTSDGNVDCDNLTATTDIECEGGISGAWFDIGTTTVIDENKDAYLRKITASSDISARDFSGRDLKLTRNITAADITGDDIVAHSVTTDTFGLKASAFLMNGETVGWKSFSYETYTRSNSRQFMYAINGNTSNPGTIAGAIITNHTSTTIYYLGK